MCNGKASIHHCTKGHTKVKAKPEPVAKGKVRKAKKTEDTIPVLPESVQAKYQGTMAAICKSEADQGLLVGMGYFMVFVLLLLFFSSNFKLLINVLRFNFKVQVQDFFQLFGSSVCLFKFLTTN